MRSQLLNRATKGEYSAGKAMAVQSSVPMMRRGIVAEGGGFVFAVGDVFAVVDDGLVPSLEDGEACMSAINGSLLSRRSSVTMK